MTVAGSSTHAGMAGSEYVERRNALRWPLVLWGLGLPVGLVVAFGALAVLVNPEWFVAVAVIPLFAPFMMGIGLLYRNWPTGIKIDEHGISIGAVGSPRAAMRRPTVSHQNWGLFSCEWGNIRDVRVVTDPWEIRKIKTSPQYWTLSNHWAKPREMNRCQAGVLTAPFTKAALVINVGYGMGTGPELRSALFFANYIAAPRPSVRLEAQPSAEWVVPTRKPDELRAFLAALRLIRQSWQPEDG